MKTEEILQRIFYVDIAFERLDNKPSSISEFRETIQDLKDKAKDRLLSELKLELIRGDIIWFDRLANQNCKVIELNLSDLCIDDYHNEIYICGYMVKRGDKIKEINNRIGNDTRIESLTKCPFFEELIRELPIVVRPYQDMYEIILGNHRAISALKKGKVKIRCLCFCEPSDSDLCNSLNFDQFHPTPP